MTPEVSATFAQLGWLVAVPLGALALWGLRRHLRAHGRLLVLVGAVALIVRLVAADPEAGDERLPYLTQATCIAHVEARANYSLCGARIFGDVHQLGTASLFALGFRLWSDPLVASAIVLLCSLVSVVLLYGVTWMAARRRDVAVGASLLFAVHPLSLHFAAATQTEAVNDCVLLLAVALLLWDARRGAARPVGAPARIAAAPIARAFFIGMAVQVRPELLVLLPLLVASPLVFRADGARLHAAVLALLSVLFVIPAAPAFLLKSEGLASAEQQLARLWEHLVDVHRWVSGSIVLTAALVLILVIGLRRRHQLALPARVSLLYAVGINAVYAVAPGLYSHVMPHQPHLVYHGSILLWPVVVFAVAAGSDTVIARCKRRPAWLASQHLTAVGVVVAAVLIWSGERPIRGFRSKAGPAWTEVAAAMQERSLAVFLHSQVFASAPIAPLLFGARSDFVVFEPSGYEGDRGETEACAPLREAAERARAHARPMVLVQTTERELDLAIRCGMHAGPGRPVGGVELVDLSLP